VKQVQAFAQRRGVEASCNLSQCDLAIDPGTSTGWALFDSHGIAGKGELVACGGGCPLFDVRRVVIELPQSYPSHPVPPNDLITLAFLAGRYAGRVPEGTEVQTVFPHEWKGNLPKDVCAARVRARLSKEELALVKACDVPEKQKHNVLDAIGIGLFAFRGIRL
jgi:hypothetical protein